MHFDRVESSDSLISYDYGIPPVPNVFPHEVQVFIPDVSSWKAPIMLLGHHWGPEFSHSLSQSLSHSFTQSPSPYWMPTWCQEISWLGKQGLIVNKMGVGHTQGTVHVTCPLWSHSWGFHLPSEALLVSFWLVPISQPLPCPECLLHWLYPLLCTLRARLIFADCAYPVPKTVPHTLLVPNTWTTKECENE